MTTALLFLVTSLLYKPVAAPPGNTIETRFTPPHGFVRKAATAGSFAAYLRGLPLKPAGAKVHYYNGGIKDADVYHAVVDLDVGSRDLQQCADAVMRLRAEWLWAINRKEEITFRFSDGFRADYSRWRTGARIGIRGDRAFWKNGSAADDSYRSFRQYLDVVFTYAGTLSLSASLKSRPLAELSIGDVFIRGGSPGHAVIVVDVVENARGEKRFLLAQSYMPAQEIHVLKNDANRDGNPWYSNRFGAVLETPEWDFKATELRTW
ncbi:MAG: hypothetical protein EOO15_08210 [Chitinophagaceae bacterium]|nr:MAG: hypothetical protein EOO15_08210 [Chitinophagaceae bacterium]